MASKLRMLLFQRGYDRPFTGSKAISLFCKAISQGVFKLEMPEDWSKLSKEKKYIFLSKALPKSCQFFLFREKQYTRKNKSAYIARMIKPPVWKPEPLPEVAEWQNLNLDAYNKFNNQLQQYVAPPPKRVKRVRQPINMPEDF